MQPDRFTIKTQEAVQAAISLAPSAATPRSRPSTCCSRCSSRRAGSSRRCCASSAPTPSRDRADGSTRALDALPTLGDGRRGRRRRRRARAGPARRRARDARRSRTSTSRPSTCCSRSPATARRAGDALRDAGRHEGGARSRPSAEVRGRHRVTDQYAEDKFQALEKFGRDLTAAAERRQARPGHRPRRRDPPRHPGPLAAARRTTRCSSASPASARPRSSRASPSASSPATSPSRCATAASSRSTSARCSPARSTAASSRSA